MYLRPRVISVHCGSGAQDCYYCCNYELIRATLSPSAAGRVWLAFGGQHARNTGQHATATTQHARANTPNCRPKMEEPLWLFFCTVWSSGWARHARTEPSEAAELWYRGTVGPIAHRVYCPGARTGGARSVQALQRARPRPRRRVYWHSSRACPYTIVSGIEK